jgi:hypothetical protein
MKMMMKKRRISPSTHLNSNGFMFSFFALSFTHFAQIVSDLCWKTLQVDLITKKGSSATANANGFLCYTQIAWSLKVTRPKLPHHF